MTNTLRQDSLRLTDAKSDKEYHLYLEPKDDGFIVRYRNGPYGNANAGGVNSKTKEPVPLERAQVIYDDVYQEKYKKGYRPMDALGAMVFTPVDAQRRSNISLQLLKSIPREEAQRYILDPNYGLQEKMNGVRRALVINADGIKGVNKLGNVASIPMPIVEAAKNLEESFVIDGELIGDVLYAFDLLEVGGKDIRAEGFEQRFAQLRTLLDASPAKAIRLVLAAFTHDEKTALAEDIESRGGEGFCLKLRNAPYDPSSRSDSQLKAKLVESATVRVLRLNEQRSFAMCVYDEDGVVTEIGNCTIPVNVSGVAEGDVCEVVYLPARTKRGGSLAEPIFIGVRDDATVADCALSQLRYAPEVA
jgi:bifunctional non-homologous end joining protein LigD